MGKNFKILFVCLMTQIACVKAYEPQEPSSYWNPFSVEKIKAWRERIKTNKTFEPGVKKLDTCVAKMCQHVDAYHAYKYALEERKKAWDKFAYARDNKFSDLEIKQLEKELQEKEACLKDCAQKEQEVFSQAHEAYGIVLQNDKPRVAHLIELGIRGGLGFWIYRNAVRNAGFLKRNAFRIVIPSLVFGGYLFREFVCRDTQKVKRKLFDQAVQSKVNEQVEDAVKERKVKLEAEDANRVEDYKKFKEELQSQKNEEISSIDKGFHKAMMQQQEQAAQELQALREQEENYRKHEAQQLDEQIKELNGQLNELQSQVREQRQDLEQRDQELFDQKKEMAERAALIKAYEQEYNEKGWFHIVMGKPWNTPKVHIKASEEEK